MEELPGLFVVFFSLRRTMFGGAFVSENGRQTAANIRTADLRHYGAVPFLPTILPLGGLGGLCRWPLVYNKLIPLHLQHQLRRHPKKAAYADVSF